MGAACVLTGTAMVAVVVVVTRVVSGSVVAAAGAMPVNVPPPPPAPPAGCATTVGLGTWTMRGLPGVPAPAGSSARSPSFFFPPNRPPSRPPAAGFLAGFLAAAAGQRGHTGRADVGRRWKTQQPKPSALVSGAAGMQGAFRPRRSLVAWFLTHPPIHPSTHPPIHPSTPTPTPTPTHLQRHSAPAPRRPHHSTPPPQ